MTSWKCIDGAKLVADRAARHLADEEHQRTTSALHRQTAKILSASSDTEREITEIKRALKKRELDLAALRSRYRSTDEVFFTPATQHHAFLKYLQPAVLQPPL